MTGDLRDTLAARRFRHRRRKRIIVLLCASYLLLLAGLSLACHWAYFWLLECPALELQRVEVKGLVRLGQEEVLAAAGVSAGAPLAALDLRRCEERLRRLEWVRSAEADLRWPLELVMHVEEKRPVALIRLDSLYYLDQNGQLIKRLSPLEGMDFPVITGISAPDFNTSRTLLCSRVLPLLAQVDRDAELASGLGSDVSEVQVGASGRLALYTTDGLLVKLGERDWQAALREAGRAVSELRRQGRLSEAAAVDASCPLRVFIKFRRGPALLAAAREARGA